MVKTQTRKNKNTSSTISPIKSLSKSKSSSKSIKSIKCFQSLQIIITLKKALKAKGIKYKDVAKHLCMSESNIKRQFTQGDISLSRLEKICDLLSMEISDLLELVQLESTQATGSSRH